MVNETQELPENNITKVELLKKLSSIYIHFTQGSSNDNFKDVSISLKDKVLNISISSKDKEDIKTYDFVMPFNIEITSMKNSKDPNNANIRIIHIKFQRIYNQKDINFSDDIEELEAQLSKDWDAKYFLNVEDICCKECSTPLINKIENNKGSKTKNIIELKFKDNTEEATKDPIEDLTDKIQTLKINNKLFNKIKNLPREGWYDLIDCWVCHKEDFSFNFSNVFQPDVDTLLVGSNHVLVNFNRLNYGIIQKLNLNNNFKILCQKCNNYLGSIIKEENQDKEEIESRQDSLPVIKLHKLSIKIKKSSASHDTFEKKDFVNLLLLDMCSHYRHSAASRFILKEWNSEEPSLLIWVFNWDVLVLKDNFKVGNIHHLIHSLKVLVFDVDDLNNDKVTGILNRWIEDEDVISLFYPKRLIEELSDKLFEKNSKPSKHPFGLNLFYDAYIDVPNSI